MLAPEVSDFRLGRPKTSVSSFKRDDKLPPKLVSPFTNLAHIVIPQSLHLPSSVSSAVTDDGEFYTVAGLDVGALLTPEFVQNFIEGGELTLTSSSSSSPQCFANSVRVTPDGVMTLVLNREAYASLGLQGNKMQSCDELRVVRIDLAAKKDKNELKRAREALQSRRIDFGSSLTFAWYPKDEEVCPSSLAKYLHDLGAVVEERAHDIRLKRTNRVIPELGLQTQITDETFDAFENWVGAVLLGVDLDNEGIFGGQALEECDKVVVATVSGLLVKRQIAALVESIRNHAEEANLPWCALSLSSNLGGVPVTVRERTWDLEKLSTTLVITKDQTICVRTRRARI